MATYQDWKATMIYNTLAHYYDGLVKDEEATQAWVNLIQKHITKKDMMELACGSGEITLALAQLGYRIDASDLSAEMIQEAKQKEHASLVHFYTMDMLDFHSDKKYDSVICLCDSINYITKETSLANLFASIHATLKEDGVFLFDTHSLDRLVEFEEEFYEEGEVNGQQYTWSIMSQDDLIYHNFLFYDDNGVATQEQHTQRVYDPSLLAALLAPYFTFEIVTDFEEEGICEGEKYFYICRRKEVQ